MITHSPPGCSISASGYLARYAVVFATMCVLTLGLWMPNAKAQVPGVIIDQDMSSDHDDVADCAAINALANAGQCRLLACMTDSQNGGTPLCQNAICTYFGNPNVPCGIPSNIGGIGTYCGTIAAEFPHPLYATYTECPNAVTLYRQILASQPDNSVVIVTTGFLNNLEGLLQTGSDGYSPLTGPQLVAQKVKLWACAGGQYPSGGEFNFTVVPDASYYVVNNWPAPATFTGFEVGSQIGTAADIASAPRTSPMRRVWELATHSTPWGGYPAWSQVAEIVGTRGAEDGLYNLFNTGRNNCNSNGTDFWSADTPPAPEAYLVETERYPMIQSINAELNMIPSTQPVPPPAQPSNVGATAVGATQINLTWDDNAYNATSYQIQRRNNTTGVYATIATLGNVTSYSDTTVSSTANAAYRVKATNVNGSSRYSYAYLYSGWTETNFDNPTALPLYTYYHSSNLDWPPTHAPASHVTVNNDSLHGQNLAINVEVGTQGNAGAWYIYFFYQDPNDWYRLNVSASASQFQKDIGGAISSIGTTGSGISMGGGTEIQLWQVNVTPGRLQFSANGAQYLNVTDTFNYGTGRIGLGGEANAPVWQNFYFDTTANVVNGLAATAGNNQVNLSWNALGSATGYNIYRSVGEGDVQLESTPIATVTGTSYTDTAGPNSTDSNMGGDDITYYYQVAAVSGSSVYFFSNEASALPPGPPAPPMGITLYGAGTTGITLLWDPEVTFPGSGTPTFNVYRGTASGGESPTPIATGITGNGYADSNLSPGTPYYYKVAAVNSSGTSSFWGELATATTGGSGNPPQAPTGLAATGGDAHVGLSWTESGGATSYDIYRGTTAGGESGTPIATGVSSTTYGDSGVTNGTTYYYKVAAANSYGASAQSNEASATPNSAGNAPPLAPTGLTATGGTNQVALTWGSSSGATSYNVYRGVSSGGESGTPIATGITSASYTDNTAAGGTAYYYEVTAVDSYGTSDYSNEVSATPSGGSGGGTPTFANASFETPSIGDYTDNPSVSSWTFTNNAGIQHNGSAYGAANAPDGVQTAFIQGAGGTLGTMSQSVDFTAGTYTISFYGAQRAGYGGDQPIRVSVDSTVVGTYLPPSTSFTLVTTATFAVTAGNHTVTFAATNASADNTVFLDEMSIASVGSAPATPTGLAAVSGSAVGQIAVSWTASAGAQDYILQRSTSRASGYSTIATIVAPAVAYTDSSSSLVAGQAYYYEIAAAGTSGTSAVSTDAFATPYVPASFSGWIYTYFGLNAPSSETADTADSAHDGLSNLLKYAFGLNPLVSATFEPVLSQSGATWQFTYQRPANRPDLTYAVQVSSNLSSWTSTGVTLSETASGNPETWQATYTPSLGSKFFFRLQVTGP